MSLTQAKEDGTDLLIDVIELNQATAVNVVPVVRELIADGGRDFDLETRALSVPDAGGAETLVEMQRTVQDSGGHLSWEGTTDDHS
jgi:hypothetical protein